MSKNIIDLDDLAKLFPIITTVSLIFYWSIKSFFDDRYVTKREYDKDQRLINDRLKEKKGGK